MAKIALTWTPITDPRDRAYQGGRMTASCQPVEDYYRRCEETGEDAERVHVTPPADGEWHIWRERTGGVCPIIGRYLADPIKG